MVSANPISSNSPGLLCEAMGSVCKEGRRKPYLRQNTDDKFWDIIKKIR